MKTPKGQSESVYRRRTGNTILLIPTRRTITFHLEWTHWKHKDHDMDYVNVNVSHFTIQRNVDFHFIRDRLSWTLVIFSLLLGLVYQCNWRVRTDDFHFIRDKLRWKLSRLNHFQLSRVTTHRNSRKRGLNLLIGPRGVKPVIQPIRAKNMIGFFSILQLFPGKFW